MSFDSYRGARTRSVAGALLLVLIALLDVLLPIIPSDPLAIPIIMGLPWFVIQNLMPAAIVGALSALYFVSGWQYGIRYQGQRWTLTNAILSGAFATTCAVLIVVSGRFLSPFRTLCIRFLIIAWIITCAFPWLGELP